MKYVLEICNTQGDGIGEEGDSCDREVESDTPIPIPNVGEDISFSNLHIVKVVRRLFAYYNETAHVQLFCENIRTPEVPER